MAINRFSQGPIAANIQSNFIPLPVDAIAKQIERKQNQYDTTKAYINSMQDEILKTKALSPDTETLKSIQQSYEDKVAQGINDLKGDYSRAGGIAEQTAKDLRKDYSQGQLGQINANYLNATSHVAKLDKLREAGIIGDRGYNLGLRSISDFQGTKEIAPGRYSSMNLYTPVKEVGIPEVSQKFAKASADQYLATGQKYINADTVARNTFNNLVRDETVMSNAKEEIRSKYGNLSPEKEDKLAQEYLWGMAKNSGHERAFLEQFQPTKTGIDENGEPITLGYDKTDINPTKSGIVGKIQTIKDYHDKSKAAIAANYYATTGGSNSISGVNNVNLTPKELERQTIEKDKAINAISDNFKTTIAGDAILMDRLKLMGIDPTKSSEQELENALTNIQDQDNSSRNTQYNIIKSAKADRAFEVRNNSQFIKDGPIVNTDNTPLSDKDRKEIADNLDAGKIKLVNGGAVYGEGQPWATGTLKVGAGDKTIMMLPNQPNSPEHTIDRLKYVFTPGSGGYTDYQNGKYKEVLQLVKNPNDPSKVAVRKYNIDSNGVTIPTNDYYILNNGEDRTSNPFKMLVPENQK